MNCTLSTTFMLSVAARIASGATIGAAPTLAPMIGAPATNAVAAAIVITNLRIMMTAELCVEITAPCSLMFALPAGQIYVHP
jgi:hypothetical protein